MKALLKADSRRILKNPLTYILLGIAFILPVLTTSMLYGLILFAVEGDISLMPAGAAENYAQSFSLLNNVGLMMIIFISLIVAQDFSQFTVRNKIIAGYSRTAIYFNVLIVNLTLAFLTTFINSSSTYLTALIFQGFKNPEFGEIFKFGLIGYSSVLMLFAFNTLLVVNFKKATGPLLLTVALPFAILLLSGINEAINFFFSVNIQAVYYAFPLLRLVLVLGSDTREWYYALLANAVHIGYLIPLGLLITKRTDFK